MLKVPDKRARNLLDLANLIEPIHPAEFDMKSWQTCICGHYLKSKGSTYIASNDWYIAADQLGLTDEQASELFAPTILDGDGATQRSAAMDYTPKQTAERIRKFAFALMD